MGKGKGQFWRVAAPCPPPQPGCFSPCLLPAKAGMKGSSSSGHPLTFSRSLSFGGGGGRTEERSPGYEGGKEVPAPQACTAVMREFIPHFSLLHLHRKKGGGGGKSV